MTRSETQQYADLVSTVDIQTQPEDKKYIEQYIVSFNRIRKISLCWTMVTCLLYFLNSYMLIVGIEIMSLGTAFVLAILLLLCAFLMLRIYRIRFGLKMNNIWVQDCDVVKYLGLYNELVQYESNSTNWGIHFYNLGTALLAAGRVEDSENVQSLMEKYCTRRWEQFFYEMLSIELAGYKKDYEEMEEHCKKLSQIKRRALLRGNMRVLYLEKMQYPSLVQMSRRGEYQELYNLLDQDKAMERNASAKVRKIFYLYKIALLLGNEKKAEEHKAFVLQAGGTLRYCAEVMNDKSEV